MKATFSLATAVRSRAAARSRSLVRAAVLVTALVSVGLLSSCATTYQPRSEGSGYGYGDFQLSATSFQVEFVGNGNTSIDNAYKFFLTRAADLALAHNYKGFYITKIQKATPDVLFAPGYAAVVGVYPRRHWGYYHSGVAITTYSPATVYSVRVPGYFGQILLVNEQIKGEPVPFDARLIYNQGMALKRQVDRRNTTIKAVVWIGTLAALGLIVASAIETSENAPYSFAGSGH